jgi:hypothetical protein
MIKRALFVIVALLLIVFGPYGLGMMPILPILDPYPIYIRGWLYVFVLLFVVSIVDIIYKYIKYGKSKPKNMEPQKVKEVKEFVKKWMDSYEPDTFIKNEDGIVIYTAGPTSLNLTVFFEDLLECYLEDCED